MSAQRCAECAQVTHQDDMRPGACSECSDRWCKICVAKAGGWVRGHKCPRCTTAREKAEKVLAAPIAALRQNHVSVAEFHEVWLAQETCAEYDDILRDMRRGWEAAERIDMPGPTHEQRRAVEQLRRENDEVRDLARFLRAELLRLSHTQDR